MKSLPTEPYFLSPIDNLMPFAYAPTLLCFPVAPSQTDEAIRALLAGLRTAMDAIPLLKGSIKAMPEKMQRGQLAVTSPWREAEDVFIVKDLRGNKEYDYSDLRARGFPPSAFPIQTFTNLDFMLDSDPPVMNVQVTLIQGGLILAPLVHHCFADDAGHSAVLRLWAACCRGNPLDEEKITKQLSRESFLPASLEATMREFTEYTYYDKVPLGRNSSHIEYKCDSYVSPNQGLFSIVRNSIRSFGRSASRKLRLLLIKLFLKYRSTTKSVQLLFFPLSNLRKLKEYAIEDYHGAEPMPWVSTMDVLSSLLLCCISDSRASVQPKRWNRNPEPENFSIWRMFVRLSRSMLGRPDLASGQQLVQLTTIVNARKVCRPPMPSDLIANVLLFAQVRSHHSKVESTLESVSAQAHKLRKRIQGIDQFYLQRTLGALRSVPDLGRIAIPLAINEKESLIISSWRDKDTCFLDWGPAVGVRCERVRSCRIFYDGMAIAFPNHDDTSFSGGIEVSLSLDGKAMERLRQNVFFNEYVQWR